MKTIGLVLGCLFFVANVSAMDLWAGRTFSGDQEAKAKCGDFCKGAQMIWNGNWTHYTTKNGRKEAVCGCDGQAGDVRMGRTMSGDQEAGKLCPGACASRALNWNRNWTHYADPSGKGEEAVCGCN